MARRVDVVLEDILDAIGMIEDAAPGRDRASFARAGFAPRGIERLLEIISEAVRHVPDDRLALYSHIAWADVRALGNLIRHEYWRVDPKIVWRIVEDDLPPLRAAIADLFRRETD